MKFIREARFMLKLLLGVGLALYLVLNYHGFVFFGKSLRLWYEGKYRAAAVADQIVSGKYPYSPLAPVSRTMLGLKIHSNQLQKSDLMHTLPPVLDSRYTRQWSPLKVDGFTLLCLSFYMACGVCFLLLHENRDKPREVWDSLGRGFLLCVLYFVWIHIATGNQVFGYSLRIPFFLNSLLSMGWAILGFLLVIKSFFLIQSSTIATTSTGRSSLLVTDPEKRPTRKLAFAYGAVFCAAFFFGAAKYEIIGVRPVVVGSLQAVASLSSRFESFLSYEVTAMNLNMRQGPSTEYSVICVLPHKTKVEVKKEQDNWAKVQAMEQEGWVSMKYIKRSSFFDSPLSGSSP